MEDSLQSETIFEKNANSLVILGIDPGSRYLGFGLLKISGSVIQFLKHGVISKPNLLANERLGFIRSEMDLLISEYQPQVSVVEKVFLGKNPQSVFRLGLARGAILSSLAYFSVPIKELAPTEMKKKLTGYGHASKKSILQTIKRLLHLEENLEYDAADALGMAYVYAQMYLLEKKMKTLVSISPKLSL